MASNSDNIQKMGNIAAFIPFTGYTEEEIDFSFSKHRPNIYLRKVADPILMFSDLQRAIFSFNGLLLPTKNLSKEVFVASDDHRD